MAGPWREMAPAERGKLLFRLADAVEAAKDELALLETTDVGKPLRGARGDVEGVIATLRYNAGAADKMEGATVPLGREVLDFTLLEPLGVTAHIVPWNFPLGMGDPLARAGPRGRLQRCPEARRAVAAPGAAPGRARAAGGSAQGRPQRGHRLRRGGG